MPSTQWTASIDGSIQRYLGDSELAFYMQSNPDGIGDMFTHVGLNAPSHYFTPERVCIAWAILRASHALMQCTVLNLSNDERPKYSFIPPKDAEDALSEANRALSFSTLSKEELIDDCLNGPRTLLSDEHLSHLTISQTDPSVPEFQQNILPPPLESMLPSLEAPWKRAISSVNFLQCQQREIGNHTLPRVQNNSISIAKRTRFIVHLFNEQDTRVILQLCKAKGVSVNNAILALCAVSWARMKSTHSGENLMPILLYTAINMRNSLPKTVETFWFLALTYYTISLPSYPPNSPLAFWHRASMAKEQTTRAVKSKLLLNRASLIAANRAKASSAGTTNTIKPQLPPHARVDPPAPSRALLGLSLLGNLDSLYKQSDYSPQVKLLSFRGASKLKRGGLLFLAQTFRNQLEFHLVWEETGFEEGIIEKWWEGVITASHEYLLQRK
ncbi:hypothetical protein Clacol_007277 [Clathrus columnatus]|uniref:Uncharacterized protein n=1 Tax=Clathrus columnatus TaxID=1419009 RepID=A0AAV5AIT0_9AGAM|nr:hypothetical protein Clacol_007277 [Clathrus columnatus]